MGAVATTTIAGVEAIRRHLALPIGSLTQMGTIRLGKRTDRSSPAIKDFVPLAALEDTSFLLVGMFTLTTPSRPRSRPACWTAPCSTRSKTTWKSCGQCPAVFEQKFVKNLHGKNVKKGKSKMDLAEQVMDDIQAFRS